MLIQEISTHSYCINRLSNNRYIFKPKQMHMKDIHYIIANNKEHRIGFRTTSSSNVLLL